VRIVYFLVRFTLITAVTGVAYPSDHGCPVYPPSRRIAIESSLRLERLARDWVARPGTKSTTRSAVSPANFVDSFILDKMRRDAVEPAPVADDYEFFRRVSIDLTGRIPSPEEIEAFVDESAPDKRTKVIDSLLASPAFLDQWTHYFASRFQVTANYYQLVGIPGRNLFYFYLRDFVKNDRSWRDVATELITTTGDTHQTAPGNFIMRQMQQGDPIQDTWDTLTNTVTSEFLGVQTQCVSCHGGRSHLEEINLYLTRQRREDFMRLSAFFARLNITEIPVDIFNQQRKGILSDRSSGVYHGAVSAQNPGARPARTGTFEPRYLFTREEPESGEWRKELARILTTDRQFARAAVNYIWARLFAIGIVDPPSAWDLDRIDPRNPPRAPWTLQPSHPELLEALSDFFIANNYRFRPLIRLLCESSSYQLASRYPGSWRAEYGRYFAKHFPRRLSAEEAYDAVVVATQTEMPMYVEGFAEPLLYATQLPDPSEPRGAGSISNFLFNLGRGDWWRTPTTSEGSVVQSLFLMNDTFTVQRSLGLNSSQGTPFNGTTRVARLLASRRNDQESVRYLFLATLGRLPSEEEIAAVMRRRGNDRDNWLSDLQWVLINRSEFLFNH